MLVIIQTDMVISTRLLMPMKVLWDRRRLTLLCLLHLLRFNTKA